MTKNHQYAFKSGGKTPLAVPGVGQAAKSPQNQSLDVAVWDSKGCRVKFRGLFVNLQTFDLTKLLHYGLVSNLDDRHASLLHTRLMSLSLPPSKGDLGIMVFRGRVAMALSDLREKLKKER